MSVPLIVETTARRLTRFVWFGVEDLKASRYDKQASIDPVGERIPLNSIICATAPTNHAAEWSAVDFPGQGIANHQLTARRSARPGHDREVSGEIRAFFRFVGKMPPKLRRGFRAIESANVSVTLSRREGRWNPKVLEPENSIGGFIDFRLPPRDDMEHEEYSK